MSGEEAKVDTPCAAYTAMQKAWPLIDDLMAGSAAMQANAAKYLPQFDKENPKHYNARVNNSSLFSAYADTFKNIASKPFSKKLTLEGELPTPLSEIADDVDGQGKTLMQLARELLASYINRGVAHVLVDYPKTTNEDGTTPNLAEERSAGHRPRFIAVTPDQLIGWRTDPLAVGAQSLAQIRITETRNEPDGLWGDKAVDYVRVIERDAWMLHREVDEEYSLLEEGVNSLGRVPLATGYSNQTGLLTADPPLKELAETNLTHYRSDSDQRNILHMARTATLFVKGFTEDEAGKIALGPNQVISTTNPEADAKFVEHRGEAIKAGQVDIDKLEERMMVLGLQPFMSRVGNQTATGQGIDESRANCDIQAWVMSLEQLLYDCYAIAADWIDLDLPDDFKVNIFNDFSIWMRAVQDIEQLIKMRQAHELSRVTFLREIKRRAIISETVDVQAEVADIEAEGPALGTIGIEQGE